MFRIRPLIGFAVCGLAALGIRPGQTTPRPDGDRLAALRHSREARADELIAGSRPVLLKHGRTHSRTIALTFDDGPHPELTTKTLKLLRDAGVKATFFMTGRNVQAYPGTALAVANAGHEIANHTFTHPNLTKITIEQMARELESTSSILESILGVSPAYFRPPGGQYDDSVLREATAQGMTTVLWTANPADYSCDTAHDVAQKVLKAAKPGGIILLHDTWDLSVEALPEILAGLKKKGLRVVPVSGLR